MNDRHGRKRQAVYLCIDLKSFYASVECVARNLDPLTTRLVVADARRGRNTICLAVTPALKELGVRNRCRLFEIPEHIDYIVARPHMRQYMDVSATIYSIYLRYISPDDIHVYSIDECFIDATPYLALYNTCPRELAVQLMQAVLDETGIYATAGIGTNLFLAKVALDITAKHTPNRIGMLDEEEFRHTIWHHRPITDIWNVGPGIAQRLVAHGIHDLAGVALSDPQLLYREFGVNAEYLIDHAWGREPCTIAQIHAYKPASKSLVNSQVLTRGYAFDEALVVLKEMVGDSVLELVEKELATRHVGLYIGYARETSNSAGEETERAKDERIAGARSDKRDRTRVATGKWGDHGGGSHKLTRPTSSSRLLMAEIESIYCTTVEPARRIRRLSIMFGDLVPEACVEIGLFDDEEPNGRERDLQKAVLAVKRKYGKNALVKGISFNEVATGRERNLQIGGHNA